MTNPAAPFLPSFGLLRLTAPLAASVLAVALAGAPAPAAEAPSPAAACAAFRDAVRDAKAPMAPLLERPDVARQAVIGCRRHDGAPEEAAALGFALIAAGEAGGVPLVRAAAEAGVGEAQYWLALWSKDGLALDGRAVLAANDRRFLRFLTKAAQGGHADAQVLLGASYAEGIVVERDRAQARRWFERAAAQEHPRGLYLLGSVLIRSDASAGSFDDGMALIGRAADLGEPHARWLLAQSALSDDAARTTTVDAALRTL